MKRTVSFITTASGKVGLGHLMRSLSLAEMLSSLFAVNFIIDTDNDEVVKMVAEKGYAVNKVSAPSSISNIHDVLPYLENTAIVVLDFYTITPELQLALKHYNLKLVCIDDLHETHFYADVVMNVSNSVSSKNYSTEGYTRLLLGTDYVLLRPVFLQSAMQPARKFDQITSVFINMGGADAPNNSLKFLKAIVRINHIKQIHLIIGLVNPHRATIIDFISKLDSSIIVSLHSNINSFEMNRLLLDCQLAICPASGISMELCAVGIGMVAGITADNQKDLLKSLTESGCAFNLGDFNLLSEAEIGSHIQAIVTQLPVINEMVTKQKKLIDGRSTDRLRKVFQEL